MSEHASHDRPSPRPTARADEVVDPTGRVRPRPPGMRMARTRGEALEGVEQDVAAEHAATLGRITAALVDAVAAWQALAERSSVSERERAATLDQVSRAAWHVLVQRESLGMGGDHLDWIERTHDVPSEALARLGVLGVLVDDAAVGPRPGTDEGIPSLRRHAIWSRRGG
jgi:hypothetical protein